MHETVFVCLVLHNFPVSHFYPNLAYLLSERIMHHRQISIYCRANLNSITRFYFPGLDIAINILLWFLHLTCQMRFDILCVLLEHLCVYICIFCLTKIYSSLFCLPFEVFIFGNKIIQLCH